MNRPPRMLALGAIVALGLVSLTACNTESTGSDESSSSGAKELTIGIANQQMSVTFPAALAKGAQAKAKELGVKLTVLDSQGDQAKQASQVQDLVAQKVDGIILVPLSPGPAQALADTADAAGIPIATAHGYVGADRKADDPYEKLQFIVNEDEIGSGGTAGDMAVAAVPDGGDVAIVLGAAGFAENTNRVVDFESKLKAAGNFNVVSSQPGDWTKEGGQSACQGILASNPDTSLFYAISDDMAVGCAAAVKAAGSDAKIIGIGGSQSGIDAVKDGSIYGTVCYKPFDEGAEAVQQMVDVLNGNPPAEKVSFYETPGITQANVDTCDPQW